MSLAMSPYVFLGRMQHEQGHGRVPARVQTADHQKMHQNSFFEVATLAIKAITLIHIQMLNYNTCNTHFKHVNQLKNIQMITTLVITSHAPNLQHLQISTHTIATLAIIHLLACKSCD